MSVKTQQKTTLPHEAVELLVGANNQIAITGPNHQITTINSEELESTAHTVMFVTTETSSSAAIAVPTTWGQRQGILVVLGKSQECLRYYGSDVAAKGGDISTAPIWYRSKRPILNVTIRGVLAVLQTATEFIVLMSDAVTCREVAVHPIVSASGAPNAKISVVRTALSDMSRGAATFIAATVAGNSSAVIDISVFNITSASITLSNTTTAAKAPVTTANLTINPETGIVAAPIYNDEAKSTIGLSLIDATAVASSADEKSASAVIASGDLAKGVKKILSVTALQNKRWLIISAPVGGNTDDVNATVTVAAADATVLYSSEVLIGNNTNSTLNKIEKKLVTGVIPSTGRVIVVNGHDVNTIKIAVTKGITTVTATADGATTKTTASSLAAAFKSAKTASTASAAAAASSSRLANWSTLIDATAADVFTLVDVASDADEAVADAIVDTLVNLNDLPDIAASSLAHLPFADWYRAAKTVKNIHVALKISHLVFLAALKRGAVAVCAIAARAFDSLYTLTGDDETSAGIAHEMRQCLQQISTWSNEQMGKQIGVVTVHCTGKSPAIKQAMFVPHQPFAVSVKRHADIDRREYTTHEPARKQ